MQAGSTPQVHDNFEGQELPNIADSELQLQQLVQQGVLTPEEAQAIKMDSSAFNNIQTDPNLDKNQMDALLGLSEIADSGGMTTMDKANLSRIANEEASRERGSREAILQNAQQRGLAGSGLELMSQMQNQQDAASRTAQRDLDVAGMAQQRALEALIQESQMAGNIQNQKFNQQAQIASANDAISKFNAQNSQNQINRNVDARNDAQTANLAAKQEIANANVGLNNQQQQYNKELLQRDFDNRMKRAQGSTGVAQTNSQAAGSDSQNRANANNQMMGALIGAGASAYGAKKNKGA
jgi:hypothetical protein